MSYRHHEFQSSADGTVLAPDDILPPERFEGLDRPGDAAVGLAIEDAPPA